MSRIDNRHEPPLVVVQTLSLDQYIVKLQPRRCSACGEVKATPPIIVSSWTTFGEAFTHASQILRCFEFETGGGHQLAPEVLGLRDVEERLHRLEERAAGNAERIGALGHAISKLEALVKGGAP